MPFMDKIKQAVKGRSHMLEKGIDTAVAQVNKRTGGKYDTTLTKRAQDLKSRAQRLDDERRDPGPGTDTSGPERPRPPV